MNIKGACGFLFDVVGTLQPREGKRAFTPKQLGFGLPMRVVVRPICMLH